MNRDFIISVVKFLNRIGAVVDIQMTKEYRNRQGNKVVCMTIEVIYKGKTNYLQHHCYHMKHGKITYEEGNKVIGVNDGILAYLGNEKDVDNYFDALARNEAKKYLEKE